MTDRTFVAVANLLAVMPSQQPWDERVAVMYAIAMRDWADSVVNYAIHKAISTQEFRPTPAKLRSIVLDTLTPSMTPRQAHSVIANIVTKVVHSERDKYVKAMVDIGDMNPIIPALITAIGGFNAIRSRTSEQNLELIIECFDHVVANTDNDFLLINPPPHPLLLRATEIQNATETAAISS
jgi:hypothetical protein